MAGGGLVAMVVVQKWGGAREGRSRGGERSSEHHGPRGGAIKITKRCVLRENCDITSRLWPVINTYCIYMSVHVHTTLRYVSPDN